MFADLMYWIVSWIARFHNWIGTWNDQNSVILDDKQLHFIVIGMIGMALLFVIYPLFKYLAKKDHTMVIAWIYVFTCMIVLTFAIEIGQGYTHTGRVEMADVVYGLAGFLYMFFVFSCIRGIYHMIRRYISSRHSS